MSAASPTVDVTAHARMRWLQRVEPNDPFPAESVRQAFAEAATVDIGGRLRGVHERLGLVLVGVERGDYTTVVTVYADSQGGGR